MPACFHVPVALACLSSDGIVGWLKKKTGPWAVEVDSADKLAALEKDNQVLFVAYFAKPEVGSGTGKSVLTACFVLLERYEEAEASDAM